MVNIKLALDFSSTWLTFKLVLGYQYRIPRAAGTALTGSDFEFSLSLARKSWSMLALFIFGCVLGKIVSLIDW